MTDPNPKEEAADAKHLASRLMAESLQSRRVLRGTDGQAVRALLPQVTVIKIGGQSIIDRGADALLPVIAELGELSTDHPLLITAGEGARARHAYDIASDLGLPTGMLATLGNSVSEQNASIISALLMDRGAVNVPMNLVPILLNGGLPVVMSGMPPYDWWEPPPRTGRVPERRTDTGTFLTAEAFGCRQVIYVKDQDGLYDHDPVTHPDARLIPTISASDLISRGLDSLPIEPIVLEMLINARLVSQLQLINGLTPGAITQAVHSEPVGTIITAR
jgi:molybdenum storage protein